MPETTATPKCRACIEQGIPGECTDPAHQVAPEIGLAQDADPWWHWSLKPGQADAVCQAVGEILAAANPEHGFYMDGQTAYERINDALRAAHPPRHHEGTHPMTDQPAYRPGDVIRFAPTAPPEQAAWVRRVGREFAVVGIEPDGTLQVWDSDVEVPGGRSVIYVDRESAVLVERAAPVGEASADDSGSGVDGALRGATARLDDTDREAVLRFAQFLARRPRGGPRGGEQRG